MIFSPFLPTCLPCISLPPPATLMPGPVGSQICAQEVSAHRSPHLVKVKLADGFLRSAPAGPPGIAASCPTAPSRPAAACWLLRLAVLARCVEPNWGNSRPGGVSGLWQLGTALNQEAAKPRLRVLQGSAGTVCGRQPRKQGSGSCPQWNLRTRTQSPANTPIAAGEPPKQKM